MIRFSKKEDAFLRNNYLTIPAKRMSYLLKRTEGSARQRMKILGIVVPPDIIEKFKQESRFKKGHISFNKDKKIGDYMSNQGIINSKKTRFKKGHLPHNTKSDFSISIRADKRGIAYKFIRISCGNWIPLHRHVWEKANGIIPLKMKLVFKDSNPMNCDLSNLELLTCGELMKRNSYHYKYPKNISQVIQLSGVLTRKINQKQKQLKNEK